MKIVRESHFFGYHEVFAGESLRRNGVNVLSKHATVERYDIRDFISQVSSNTELFNELFTDTLEYENRLWKRIKKMKYFKTEKKVAWMLMDIASAHDEDPNKLCIEHYTHQLLGEYAGTSRQTITTTLSDFRRLGILEYDRNQIIIDNALMKHLIDI